MSAASSSASAAAAAPSAGSEPQALLSEDAAARAVYVPITYGTISQWIGKKPSPAGLENSHRWTAYVRSADGRDLSHAVARVVFTLHPTFAQPKRECLAPPYEVTEVGWGAFDIGIAIFLREGSPIHLVHRLKLYPSDGSSLSLERPVIDDHYDEIVFNALPADGAVRAALLAPPAPQPLFADQHLLPEHDAGDDLARVKAARIKVAHDLRLMEERLALRRAEAARLREDLKTLGLL